MDALGVFAMFFIILSVLNITWFSAGFWAFSLNAAKFTKIMVPRQLQQGPVYNVLVEVPRAVGGFNLAFLCLCFAMLVFSDAFAGPLSQAILFAVISIAHGTQFFFNLPNALKDWNNNEPQWPVLKGPMLFIFIGDFALMVLNAIAAVCLILLN